VGGSLGIAVMGAIVASGHQVVPEGRRCAADRVSERLPRCTAGRSLLLVLGAIVAIAAVRKIEHPHEQREPVPEAA